MLTVLLRSVTCCHDRQVEDYVIDTVEVDSDDPMAKIPQRFIDGCFGDMVEAQRRWKITYDWRWVHGSGTGFRLGMVVGAPHVDTVCVQSSSV